MNRLQLVEIEDLPWCPRFLRDAATDYLRFVFELTHQYRPVGEVLRTLLRRHGQRRIIDLCSGAGGPWESLASQVQLTGEHTVSIALTDKYPSGRGQSLCRDADDRLTYVKYPVDATNVPARLAGIRTMFTAFHHFDPASASAVLRDAARRREPIAIFEVTQRSLVAVLTVAVSPFLVLLLTPFIRPFSWTRLFFTYVIPALPLFILFDGLVSCLRSYSPEEMLQLAGRTDAPGFAWESGTLATRTPLPVTYLVGYPADDPRGSAA
jgi:hypothetical protein